MADAQAWQLLPPQLVELQLGQIDLLLAMYPDEAVVEENSTEVLNNLRDFVETGTSLTFTTAPIIPVQLRLPIDDSSTTLQLDLPFTFTGQNTDDPQEPPPVRVRVQQPSWLSRAATSQLTSSLAQGEDLLGTISHIQEAAAQQLSLLNTSSSPKPSPSTTTGPLVRVWFYFPSISTRSKRDDFITHAPSYHLTGFLYAGKPGLLCVEGESQSIDDYMKFIKTESWGDIPAHHKKVSERYREKIEERVFADMTETTDLVGERRGQRANRGDMKAVEEWLVERGLGEAFAKVLM